MVGTQQVDTATARRVLLVGGAIGASGHLGHDLAVPLRAEGYLVEFAMDGMGALSEGGGPRLDLVVATDDSEERDSEEAPFEGHGVFAFVRRFRVSSDVPIIVVSAADSVAACEAAMRAGADRFLQYARALERLGPIARELVEGRCDLQTDRRRPLMTAREARGLRERELFEALERLLVETRGNISEIARRMGRDRSTVRYHLKRFGMLEATRVSPGQSGRHADSSSRSGARCPPLGD